MPQKIDVEEGNKIKPTPTERKQIILTIMNRINHDMIQYDDDVVIDIAEELLIRISDLVLLTKKYNQTNPQ